MNVAEQPKQGLFSGFSWLAEKAKMCWLERTQNSCKLTGMSLRAIYDDHVLT